MKNFTIKNFISEDNCKILIQHANNFTNKHDFFKYHVNRNDLSSSNLAFYELIQQSENWNNLANRLNSNEFYKECCEKLGLDSNKFCKKNYFNIESPTTLLKKYKFINNLKINLVNSKSLFKYLIYRIYRDLYRSIKFSNIFYINKIPLEVLYNYSRAGNGYFRDIHRDSDSRLIVFILFLNQLSENATGGTLDLYKLINKDKNLATPEYSSCKIIDSIKPETGKLFVFRNGEDSYHAVSRMNNHNDFRQFIYGSFTILSGKNPYIKNYSKLPTEFHLYD